MESKTIKGIKKDRWILFKTIAANYNISLGELFGIILEDYTKRSDFVWKRLLKGEKILSDEEAVELEKTIKETRKERGFRV